MIRSYRGQLPQIAEGCYVDLSAQVLGDVTLGAHSSVWMNAVLRGDVNSIRVGANSNVQDCAVLHGQWCRRERCGPGSPQRCGANSATRTAPSSSNTRRTIWTTPRSTLRSWRVRLIPR